MDLSGRPAGWEGEVSVDRFNGVSGVRDLERQDHIVARLRVDRAGRRTESSLAVLVAQDDPLDQYLVAHPADLFERPPEAAVIDPTNPYFLEPHLACAAREQPLAEEELAFFGPAAERAAACLEERGELVRRRGVLHHRGQQSPHRRIDIRSAGGGNSESRCCARLHCA